tara:strand:- start:3813 stop:4130 length:318 start_codon:yes stop_codon:yes gene_type:complete
MGPITNAIYPKPCWALNSAVAGQQLSATTTAAVQFSSLNDITTLVVLDIQVANVYCTFDGTTPSSSRGHILYATQSYTWSRATAAAAKFIGTTATATIWGSEFQV